MNSNIKYIGIEGREVPLIDKNQNIIDYAIVSIEDFDQVCNYSWSKAVEKTKTTDLSYAVSSSLRMHHLIQGKPEQGFVVDHINHDGLDNRRSNLRFATISQNSQNARRDKTKDESQYTGVKFDKRRNKWNAQVKLNKISYWLGTFLTEKEAGIAYDTVVLVANKGVAKHNGLVQYEDVSHLNIDDILPKKEPRKLPQFIYQVGKSFHARTVYDEKLYISKNFETVDEAILKRDEFLKEINQLKQIKIDRHYEKPITRNKYGIACIFIKGDECLVDDAMWHELTLFSWSVSKLYATAQVDKNTTLMHHYVIKSEPYQLIDHINWNKLDNRKENLRIATYSQNNHNQRKTENCSSKYYGVSLEYDDRRTDPLRWKAQITRDKKIYNLGRFETEVEAAHAYNLKAKELYGTYARLNDIDQSELEIVMANSQQKHGRYKKLNGKSNYIGVSQQGKKWKAQFKINKKTYYKGGFDTQEEAALAYNAISVEILGVKAKLNIVPNTLKNN